MQLGATVSSRRDSGDLERDDDGDGRRRRVHLVGAFALVAGLVGAAFGSASPIQADESGPATPVAALAEPLVDRVSVGIGAAVADLVDGTEIMIDAAEAPAILTSPACPVPAAEFIDSWGFPRSGGRRHKGVDMMAPHGAPVVAPVAGTVRHSNSRLGGLGFYLTDADGNEYFGSHLRSLGPVGSVEAGDLLGTVGSTGNASASGPHLHFEVMLAGRGTVNPYPHVADWCATGRPWPLVR